MKTPEERSSKVTLPSPQAAAHAPLVNTQTWYISKATLKSRNNFYYSDAKQCRTIFTSIKWCGTDCKGLFVILQKEQKTWFILTCSKQWYFREHPETSSSGVPHQWSCLLFCMHPTIACSGVYRHTQHCWPPPASSSRDLIESSRRPELLQVDTALDQER